MSQDSAARTKPVHPNLQSIEPAGTIAKRGWLSALGIAPSAPLRRASALEQSRSPWQSAGCSNRLRIAVNRSSIRAVNSRLGLSGSFAHVRSRTANLKIERFAIFGPRFVRTIRQTIPLKQLFIPGVVSHIGATIAPLQNRFRV